MLGGLNEGVWLGWFVFDLWLVLWIRVELGLLGLEF